MAQSSLVLDRFNAAIGRCAVSIILCLASGCEGNVVYSSSASGAEGPAATLQIRHGAAIPEPLRLATWNLQWLSAAEQGRVRRSPADLDRLQGYADRLNADVVAIQEVAGGQALAAVFSSTDYEFVVSQGGGAQRVAFAWRRALALRVETKEVELGGPRPGLALELKVGSTRPLTLLNIHLKSGCFESGPTETDASCAVLRQELEQVESWAERHALQHKRFVVLGDFNRRLFTESGDPLWSRLNDGVPSSLSFWSPTENGRPKCWGGRYEEFIDHLLFDREALSGVVQGSFAEMTFDVADRPHQNKLSDHCPLWILWRP